MSENYFNELNSVNVGDKIEKKNGLSYLSWAWAWTEVKKVHPTATYHIYENNNGWFYHTDGKTCWVKTGVTINDIQHIEYLPVMDLRNKSISIESVTSFDVNKAIQRSLTKAVARHGLGLYIYAGEDIPNDESDPDNKKEKKDLRVEIGKMLMKLAKNDAIDAARMLEKFTSFTGKDGNEVKGKSKLSDLSEKMLQPTYGKIKAELLKLEGGKV